MVSSLINLPMWLSKQTVNRQFYRVHDSQPVKNNICFLYIFFDIVKFKVQQSI